LNIFPLKVEIYRPI